MVRIICNLFKCNLLHFVTMYERIICKNLCPFKTFHNCVFGSMLLFQILTCDNLTIDVILAVSYLVQRSCGPGCLVSSVSLGCFNSSPCSSCQNLPASCCWTEETNEPVKKVYKNIFSLRGFFLLSDC